MKPPLLNLIQNLQWSISSGRPLKESLENILRTDNSSLGRSFGELWVLKSAGQKIRPEKCLTSFYQTALWDLIERSSQGQPITEPLRGLEAEVAQAAQAELESHVATLPFKALIPLLAFQFPAFLIILLGPILRDLHSQLGAL